MNQLLRRSGGDVSYVVEAQVKNLTTSIWRIASRASIVYEIIVRFSWDFYEMILVGKFPSREISEKCASCCSRITDIQTLSFIPLHRSQHNVRILAVVSLSAAEQWRHGGGDSNGGGRVGHHLCNSELCCNNWLMEAAALPRAYRVKHEVIVWSCGSCWWSWSCRPSARPIALPPSSFSMPVCVKSFVYHMQSDSLAGTSVLSAGHKQCYASGSSSLA